MKRDFPIFLSAVKLNKKYIKSKKRCGKKKMWENSVVNV